MYLFTSVLFRYTVIIITIKLVVLKQLQTRHQASPPWLHSTERAAAHTSSECIGKCTAADWEAQAASPPCILAAVLHDSKLLSQESARDEVWRAIALWLNVRESRGLSFLPCPWLWADSSVPRVWNDYNAFASSPSPFSHSANRHCNCTFNANIAFHII